LLVERNLILSILKLTKNNEVLVVDVKTDARVASNIAENLLDKLQSEGLLILTQNCVNVDGGKRLQLAVKAVSLGADVESVSNFLQWKEFESIAATAFADGGYEVVQNLRFKHNSRRWEIDVVGCRKPVVVCVDCKNWHHGLSPSVLRRIVKAQVERTLALADALPALVLNLECAKWSSAKFIPVVLTLMSSRFKFCDNVPVVPVLQLRDFLCQLPVEVESLTYFQKDFVHLSHGFRERRLGNSQSGN
jgi:Holliday junction resolvase-like predicted endonuclease